MKRRTRAADLAISSAVLAFLVLSSALGADREAAEKDAANAGLTVIGTVTDADGKPIPEATVSVVHTPMDGEMRVVSQMTNADGRYRCRLASTRRFAIVVVGWKPGYAVGFSERENRFGLDPGEALPDGAVLEKSLSLARSQPLTLRVVDADGNAVSGGRVGVSSLSYPDGSTPFYANRILLEHLTYPIGKDASVTLDFVPEGYGAGLLVETANHGTQGFLIGRGRVADGATMKLLPTGRIDVSLIADDPAHVRDRELTIESRPERRAKADQPPLTTVTPFRGLAVVRTDDSGKATAVIPAGRVTVRVTTEPEDRVFPETMQPVVLEPGDRIDMDVKFLNGVKIRGRVLTDRDEPVAGVELSLAGKSIRSGDDGRLEAWIHPSKRVWGSIVDVPAGYVWPYDSTFNVPTPDEAAENASADAARTLPTIRVKKAVPVRGTVVDESGQPVSQATVKAAWVQTHEERSYFTLKSDSAQSDEAGCFTLHHVHPNVDIRLTVETGTAATKTATVLNTDGAKEIELQVTPDGMVDVAGRARGADGSPIPNAEIRLSRANVAPNGHQYGYRSLTWNGSRTFPADSQGRFKAPERVPRDEQYSVAVSAPGYLAAETKFLSPPAEGPTFDVGEIELTKARTARGIVRDSAGKPLPDILVWSHAAPKDTRRYGSDRATAKTDAEGRFTLEQLHPYAAVAFAEKDGYRISGAALMIDAAELSITLFRNDEPIPAEHAVHPAVFDSGQRHAAARQLLTALLPELRKSQYFHNEAIPILARFDPETALAEIGQSKSSTTRAKALALLGEIPDALAEAESIEDGYSRAFARFAILDRIDDPDEARAILAATLLDAQSIRRPDRRIVVIANIVDRFVQWGDKSRAEQILREELPQARELSTKEWPGYARASFAERLALFEPETALKMVGEADPDDHARHYQNIAHALAAVNPDMAEAALGRIGKHNYIDAPAVRVAYRMASVDWERAVRLLDRIDEQQRPTQKAHGRGVIAFALKDSNPSKARELLKQAFDAIPKQAGGGSRADRTFGAALTLLRFAEHIDPDNLTDYYWRTLSKHPGPEGGAWSPDRADIENAERQAQLALVLALYDPMPGLAQQVTAPVFECWENRISKDPGRFTDQEATFRAMALTDPARAADWAVRFYNQLAPENRRYIPQPWQVIGNTLTDDRESIGKSITENVFHQWTIDRYDF